MSRRFLAVVCGMAGTWMSSSLLAATIAVPNGSFEAPSTGFVSVLVDSWQKSPKPDWYLEGGGFLWAQLIGLFKNTGPTSPDHIVNLDGSQAVWLFAIPEVALFQDYETVDADDLAPTHDFDATYEAGKSYQLTIGVIGTGGGMQQGATLDLSLYYRDAASNRVAIAVTSITNTIEVFTNNTQLVDFSVSIPPVRMSDPWLGKHIGIQVLSTVSTNLEGGYWDLDNVRLTSFEEPSVSNPSLTNGVFQFTIQSDPGLAVEILSSTNTALPLSSWTREAIVTNTMGRATYSDETSATARFYQAVRLTR